MAYNPLNPNGQATMANSTPVVIASDQSSIPVTGTFWQTTQPVSLASLPALAAGSNAIGSITNTVFGATQSGTWDITNISGTISLPTGAATETTLSGINTKLPSGLTVSSTRLLVDGSGVTQPISGTVTANAGTGTMNATLVSGATGGDSVFHLVSAATTNATNIKASAGKVTGWYIYNSNASARKVAFHNTAGTPTAGSSVYYTVVIPGLAATNVSFPSGLDFSTGIAVTTVTDLTDSGSTAVAANDLNINIYYK